MSPSATGARQANNARVDAANAAAYIPGGRLALWRVEILGKIGKTFQCHF